MTDGAEGSAVRTFLIADVRGYTRYTHEHGDEAAGGLAAAFAELARRAIESRGGELLELRGDEALGVFGSAREALRAAVDLQQLVRESDPPFPLGVGIGLDAGEAVAVEGGYRGGALNLAARLCSLAAPGQILASETIAALARRMEGIRFGRTRYERLKGLEQPIRVIEVVPETLVPSTSTQRASLRRMLRGRPTRRTIAALMTAVAAGTAVLAAQLLDGAGGPSGGDTRVAIVLAQHPEANPLSAQFNDGLVRAARDLELDTESLVVDDVNPDRASLDRVRTRLGEGDFDLVIWAGYGEAAASLVDVVHEKPGMHVVYVDADLRGSSFEGSPNITAVRLETRPAARLAGYLGGLMARKRGGVSVVGGIPLPTVLELVGGFREGALRARPGIAVRTDYSENFLDQPVCEELANEQIDAGSSVVFTAAGECGTGAIAAAGIRGVWAVGVDRDQSHLGSHVLASVVKHFDRAVEVAVRRFVDGTLPAGKTVELGIEEEAVGVVGISSKVPQAIRKKVAKEAARIRAQESRRP